MKDGKRRLVDGEDKSEHAGCEMDRVWGKRGQKEERRENIGYRTERWKKDRLEKREEEG